MKPWSNPAWVAKTPLLTVLLLEGANIGQIYRMWSEFTADGQSLLSWVLVNLALICWGNWYRVLTPSQKWARRCNAIGICLNSLVCLSVIYFRYIR